ncbi:MAG: hypothetical protein ACR2IG_10030 [Roseomonas sp.]
MDNRLQPVMIMADTHHGLGAFGWKVAEMTSLQAMAARLDAIGHRGAE